MELTALDPGDDVEMSSAYGVECAATGAVRPDWVPLGKGARLLGWRADDGWDPAMVGAWDGGHLIGLAVSMSHRESSDTSWLAVSVLPEHQRRGVGTALVRGAETAGAAHAPRLVASAYLPTHEAATSFTQRFAHPLGYALASTETVVELDLTAYDRPVLSSPPGYAVSTHVGGVPERLRMHVGRLKGLVDAEAPNGDLDWSETPVSPEQYAEEIARWSAQGRTPIESVAQDSHGDVAAWTCLVAAADPRRPAQVEGTLVLAAHRGQGLGAAVKSASLGAALAHGVTRVRTSSDDANVWMRAINADPRRTPPLQRRRPRS